MIQFLYSRVFVRTHVKVHDERHGFVQDLIMYVIFCILAIIIFSVC